MDINTVRNMLVRSSLGWIDLGAKDDAKEMKRLAKALEGSKVVEKKEEPLMEGAKVCKVTDERKHLPFIGDYYDFDDLCTDVTWRDSGEDMMAWFERQAKRLNDIFAEKREKRLAEAESKQESFHCFTSDTLLLTEDGSTITFKELAAVSRSGEEIPSIASSWDESGKIVYQKPTTVIDHGLVDSTLLFIGATDDVGSVAPLKVTDNHPLKAERNGVETYIPAGELAEGDILIGLEGRYNFDRSATLAVAGASELYDISFSTADGENTPTFLVSSDGKTWFVAHNKTY